MKKTVFATLAAVATLFASTSAMAMTPKTVNYTCQGGKNINVTYTFNKQNLPTKATAKLNGATRTMKTNLAQSDLTGTTFGKAGSYMIDTDYVDATTYNQVILGTVTAPNNKIIYKECRPN
ncbi:DUF7606 domain-containing protein [Kingella negevensis]|uniref:ACP-like domain-containing protein n=1 Tax=Kingella negevensis TaxID=1522312 RepID=A0A238TE32_9NEIS|nr:hypothetical protein [Kingella negevensis]MDK4679545.1 hypothetical protein [Kingella negevensis]MDK4682737.1 hypothetical protein [Kingella negevensis]MDK4685111.1 hypothetical protein [Kingella negevensis]MDK4688987.1 hypothetical protein [Kingella negevensis]MDK4690934.1 hypothetical protein [Kingella negevensis]